MVNNQLAINRALRANLLDLDKHLGWNHKLVLTQFTVRRTANGWQVIIKGLKGHRKVVSYIDVETFPDALELAGLFAEKGLLTWGHDRYPVRVK